MFRKDFHFHFHSYYQSYDYPLRIIIIMDRRLYNKIMMMKWNEMTHAHRQTSNHHHNNNNQKKNITSYPNAAKKIPLPYGSIEKYHHHHHHHHHYYYNKFSEPYGYTHTHHLITKDILHKKKWWWWWWQLLMMTIQNSNRKTQIKQWKA